VTFDGQSAKLENGAVVIAAITSCTNTSNPSVMLAAGLLAKKAVERGLQSKPWVKTSLAPGSTVALAHSRESGLADPLEQLNVGLLVHRGAACIGNRGPLAGPVAEAVQSGSLVVPAVPSRNHNLEGRVNPPGKANSPAPPPLAVA